MKSAAELLREAHEQLTALCRAGPHCPCSKVQFLMDAAVEAARNQSYKEGFIAAGKQMFCRECASGMEHLQASFRRGAREAAQAGKHWALDRWNAEVANRPERNIHYKALDGTWRQVERYFEEQTVKYADPPPDEKEEKP